MTAADDLHQRGLQAAAAGQFEEAVGWLGQAVEAAPHVRLFRTNLGLGLARAGRAREAIEAYRMALTLEPGHAGTLAKLGRVLSDAGEMDEAVAALTKAAGAEPDNPDTANALGAALGTCGGRDEEARRALRRAVALDPEFGEAWRNLGMIEARAGHWAEAAQSLAHAVELEPPSAILVYQYGVALGRTGRRQEAIDAYRRALELDSRLSEAWNNLAHQLAALGEREQALSAVQHALKLRPEYVEARYNLGVTLQSLERLDEARTAYQLVLAAAGGAHADAFNNLGGLCLSEGNPQLAIPLYRQALSSNARHPEAAWNLGLAHLSAGEWEEGWRHYEARPLRREEPPYPRWRRADCLAGRAVMVWCEQGLGDGVQFLRLANELRRLGAAKITVECPQPLASLFACAQGVDEVVARGAAPRLTPDYQVPLMSLAYELGLRPDAVPPPGPAYELAGLRARWRQQLDTLTGRKIGIVWGGNPDNRAGLNRSMPLAELARLTTLDGVTLVNLQHGPQHLELAAHPQIANWPQESLPDTAALAAEVDLVITVDTLMAHLAGTLARATWVLLPYAADWRWMTGREDSPWYPGMRLFRQPKAGDWPSVMAAVRDALRH